ncbi:phage antirepressor KilAC domain-containing protein [Tissierella praeacuta]|uniref:phage antirepressor KilAC domain-containing protein n=1 Tax=Tissierella praeacuta TaxID=43131 RepID=UPI001C114E72|nr:phage antirepressor KilAC domain-containing protein [Tissierella praeacuta]MBU5254996.1 phage antirepressor KilAC domain-containing protein [Tissierella praeacuta]
MNKLIKINYDNDRYTTSARDLWEFLGKPYTEFPKWFNHYKEYGFAENLDFRVIDRFVDDVNVFGGKRKLTDYEITVDMAKELAMLQKSEKGKVARQYFIELEKKWNSPEAIMARALKMADMKIMEYQNTVTSLENKIELDKPKVIFADAVTASHTSILIGELAKILRQNDVQIGQNRLFEWLRNNGYLIKRKGTDYNMPTQYSMELGLFEVKETSITHSDGHISISKTSKVTGKGQVYFINKFKEKQDTTKVGVIS